MERIVITGGSGPAGANIAKTLVSKFDVYAFYNKNMVAMDGVNFIRVDLSERLSLK